MIKQAEVDLNKALAECLRITFCSSGELGWKVGNDHRSGRMHGELVFVGRRSPEGALRAWVTCYAALKLLEGDLLLEFVPQDGSLDRFRIELQLTQEAVNARTVERARQAEFLAGQTARDRLEDFISSRLEDGREAEGLMGLLDAYVAERMATEIARVSERITAGLKAEMVKAASRAILEAGDTRHERLLDDLNLMRR